MADDTGHDGHELPAWLPSTPPPRSSSSGPSLKRRRASREYDSGNSSDVPAFSSDDLNEAAVDNYATPRAKRFQKRAWYEHEGRDRFTHADSGVFLASDSSDSDGFGPELQTTPNVKMPRRDLPSSPFPKRPALARQPTAQSIIYECLDRGQQVVDLSNLGLTAISSAAFSPLQQLVLPPKSSHPSADESGSSYRPLKPRLEIYLGNNLLRKLPGELMRLEALTVLSIRQNNISELPSSFSRLHNLCELNVSSNHLTALPWEILNLLGPGRKLKEMISSSNPFQQAFDPHNVDLAWSKELLSQIDAMAWQGESQKTLAEVRKVHDKCVTDGSWKKEMSSDDCIYRSWLLKSAESICQRRAKEPQLNESAIGKREIVTTPIILGSTVISWLGIDGQHIEPASREGNPGPALPSLLHSNPPLTERAIHSSRVKSLFELALGSCASSPYMPDIDRYLPDEVSPIVLKALDTARSAIEEGGKQCTMCGRSFIVPRAQWIEYWHCKEDMQTVTHDLGGLGTPFIRKVCSWKCARPGHMLPT